MSGGHVFQRCSSSRNSLRNPAAAAIFHQPIKRYGKGGRSGIVGSHGSEEKAPSMAEEFERVAEERKELKRAAESRRGVASSQRADEAFEAADEAIVGEQSTEKVNNTNGTTTTNK